MFLAFGEVAELCHVFEFLAPNWGPVIRLPNVFRLCLAVVAILDVGDRVKLSGIGVVGYAFQ